MRIKILVAVLVVSMLLGIRPTVGAQAQDSSNQIIGAAVCGVYGEQWRDLCLIRDDYSIEHVPAEGDVQSVVISGSNLYVAATVGQLGEYAQIYGVFAVVLKEAMQADAGWQRIDVCPATLSCGNMMYALPGGAVSYTVSEVSTNEANAWGYSQTQWNSWSPLSGTVEKIVDNGFRSLSFRAEESEDEIVPGVPSWVRFTYPTPFEGWNFENIIVRTSVGDDSYTQKWVPTIMSADATVGLSLETTSLWGFPHYTGIGAIFSGHSELIVWSAADRMISHYPVPEGMYVLNIAVAGEIPQRPQ